MKCSSHKGTYAFKPNPFIPKGASSQLRPIGVFAAHRNRCRKKKVIDWSIDMLSILCFRCIMRIVMVFFIIVLLQFGYRTFCPNYRKDTNIIVMIVMMVELFGREVKRMLRRRLVDVGWKKTGREQPRTGRSGGRKSRGVNKDDARAREVLCCRNWVKHARVRGPAGCPTPRILIAAPATRFIATVTT